MTPKTFRKKKMSVATGPILFCASYEQDVRGFWQFVNEQTGGDAGEAEKLAEAFVGRTRMGSPLGALARNTDSRRRTGSG